MNPKDIKYPDYDLCSDKEAKEKMMDELLDDTCDLLAMKYISVECFNSIFDRLIRRGWRKVSHE